MPIDTSFLIYSLGDRHSLSETVVSKPSKAPEAAAPPVGLPPIDLNQRYAMPEAAAYLRCSRAWVHLLAKAKKLAIIKDGRRRYVSGRELARLSGGAQ